MLVRTVWMTVKMMMNVDQGLFAVVVAAYLMNVKSASMLETIAVLTKRLTRTQNHMIVILVTVNRLNLASCATVFN